MVMDNYTSCILLHSDWWRAGSGYNCYQRIVDGKEDLDFKPIRQFVHGSKPATLVKLKIWENNIESKYYIS